MTSCIQISHIYRESAFYLKQTEFAMPLRFMFSICFQKIIILQNGSNTHVITMLIVFKFGMINRIFLNGCSINNSASKSLSLIYQINEQVLYWRLNTL